MRIHAVDDAGRRFGPASLAIAAGATVHFNSTDLENGSPGKGLSGGIGDGDGDWRLELASELDIEPLAYIRTPDGFLTSIHDIVPGELVPGSEGVGSEDDSVRHHVRFFNPASNRNQISRLRVINTAGVDNAVVIRGVDDRGRAGEGEVSFTLPAYGARTVTAQALEEGAASATIPSVRPQRGRLGDGTGKWQLFVSSEDAPGTPYGGRPLQVMSLLFSRATGNLTNLSTIGTGNDPTRGGPGTDWLSGGAGDDVIDPGDNDDEYDWVLGSRGNDRIVYTDSGPSAYQALSYVDLDTGIAATVDGGANRATVTKGSAGADTIVDVANPLNAGRDAPYGGFGLAGSRHADTFDLTLADGQWMEVRGEGGDDTINIRSGSVRVNYRLAPGPVDVDLGAGRASDDGYGNVDTFVGDVYEVEGGPHDDTLRGSDGSDRLNGGAGNDVLDPGDNDYDGDTVYGSVGNDRIIYTGSSPRAWQGLDYGRAWRSKPELDTRIEATIDGPGNRATVRKGAAGTDTIVDIAKPLGGWWVGLFGTPYDDTFHLTVGDRQGMMVRGNAGNDTFNFHHSGDGTARLDYRNAPAGVDVDLGAGRASNDGYGDVDTINGHVREVRGSDFSDVLRGSDNDERFIGRGGDDVIDGGGGYDQLRLDRSGVGNLIVFMSGTEGEDEDGTATGTWDGKAFSYTFSNIEHVRGGSGLDILVGGHGDDTFSGGGELDLFVEVGASGNDTIVDFSEEDDDVLYFTDPFGDHGLTHADIIAAARQDGGDVLIDLTRYGGGTIRLKNFSIDRLDAEDIRL